VSTLAEGRARQRVREATPAATATEHDSVKRVSAIYRDFIVDLRGIVQGRMNFLVDGDEDSIGADFAFCLEVPRADYERAVDATSKLEAEYFAKYGVNFLVIPEVM
jgi:hypothetical protein